MGNIRLFLRANERLFVNGAVLRADRKVSFELLNDATFLLENHVLQKEDATTPLRQMYFVVQLLLIDPKSSTSSIDFFKKIVSDLLDSIENEQLRSAIKEVDIEVSSGKAFSALKMIRELYPLEEMILNELPNAAEKHLLSIEGNI